MNIKKEREGMKGASKGLFKEGQESQKFCKWCDKKIKECEFEGNHDEKEK